VERVSSQIMFVKICTWNFLRSR